MEYTKATIDDMEEFYDLVQNTIQEVYPKYYPEEVVRFFSQQHCWENLERDHRMLPSHQLSLLYTPIQHLIHNFNLGQVTFQLGTGVFQKNPVPN